MKNTRTWMGTALLALGLVVVPVAAHAQCAMCKATAETNAQGGGVEAEGLNAGIVYLMAMPYVMMGAVGFFWYRSTKKKRAV
jgi:hypothetical protein